MNLKGRSFLKLLDFTPSEIEELIDLAADLKAKKKAGIPHADFRGKNIALIFELKDCLNSSKSLAYFNLRFSANCEIPPKTKNQQSDNV